MEKTPRTGPRAPDNKSVEKRVKIRSFVKGSIKGDLKYMRKNANGTHSKDVVDRASPPPASVDRFDGDGYSIRRLSREESRRAGLEGYVPEIVGPTYYSTEDFLAALAARPAADDPSPVATVADADLR